MSPADLLPPVYDEFRKLAGAKLVAKKSGESLDAGALIEALLNLGGERAFAVTFNISRV